MPLRIIATPITVIQNTLPFSCPSFSNSLMTRCPSDVAMGSTTIANFMLAPALSRKMGNSYQLPPSTLYAPQSNVSVTLVKSYA